MSEDAAVFGSHGYVVNHNDDSNPVLNKTKIIVHLDMDAFYCQVEERRLGLVDKKTGKERGPFAVVQWNGLIAVNYAAKSVGIGRHCNLDEAKKLAPDLKWVHVATFGEGDAHWKYYEKPDRRTHKVSLDPYRDASKEIMEFFKKHCKRFEKASVDEAFMDLTEEITKEYESLEAEGKLPTVLDWDGLGLICDGRNKKGSHTVIDKEGRAQITEQEGDLDDEEGLLGLHLATNSEGGMATEDAKDGSRTSKALKEHDVKLWLASRRVRDLRQKLWDTLYYRVSAGISHNKMLSKLGSAMNKPNNQTTILGSGVLGLMEKFPLRKIRNMGGKLGAEIIDTLGVENAGEVWQYTVEELTHKFGRGNAVWIHDVVRGHDDSEVVDRTRSKSMLAAKSFAPVKNDDGIMYWIQVLANELVHRMKQDQEENSRIPKTLHFYYRGRDVSLSSQAVKSRSCPMPANRFDASILAKRCFAMFKTCPDALPCSRIALGASGFKDGPVRQSQTLSAAFARKRSHREDDETKTAEDASNKPVKAETEKRPLTAIKELKEEPNKPVPPARGPLSRMFSEQTANGAAIDTDRGPVAKQRRVNTFFQPVKGNVTDTATVDRKRESSPSLAQTHGPQ
eukprot:Clim_evm23s165 gene=Clim_evmTU23s165